MPFWSDELPLHKAAFDGDQEQVDSLIHQYSGEGTLRLRLEQLDKHGMTPLMLASWRQYKASLGIVRSLLQHGADPRVKSRGPWRAYHLAIDAGQKEVARVLLAREVEMEKKEAKGQKERLLCQLAEMHDMTFSLAWEVGSTFPGLGLLLRSLAPSDTYHITKQGRFMRVDGSMMGLDKKQMKASVLPKWKKGSFSLIHTNVSSSSTSLVLIDRIKERWIDINAWRKKAGAKAKEEVVERHVAESFERRHVCGRVVKTNIMVPELKFQPLMAGWLSSQPLEEKVAEWGSCQVLQSTVELSKRVKTMAHLLPVDSWESYLERGSLSDPSQEDEVTVQPLDPLSKKASKGRSVSAKLWCSDSFPLKLDELVPLLEVIGSANAAFGKVGRWMQRFSTESLFPVKIIVPIAFTVFIQVQIKSFQLLDKSHTSPVHFFCIPPSYTQHEPKIPETFLSTDSSEQEKNDFEI